MKLDSGYRCETCDSKQGVDLWVIDKNGCTTEKILCLAHAVKVEEAGAIVHSAIGLELERRYIEQLARGFK